MHSLRFVNRSRVNRNREHIMGLQGVAPLLFAICYLLFLEAVMLPDSPRATGEATGVLTLDHQTHEQNGN